MKKIFVLLLAISIFTACDNQWKEAFNARMANNKANEDNPYTILGSIDSTYSGQVYLLKREAGEWINLDTADVVNGVFKFIGNIKMPELYYMQIEGSNRYASFFVESGIIDFKSRVDEFHNAEITGSAAQLSYDNFQNQADDINKKQEEVWKNIKNAQQAENDDDVKKWEQIFDDLDAEYKQFILDYTKVNNTTVVSAYILIRNAYYFDETDMEPIVTNFDPSIANSKYVISLTERVETLKKVAIGKPAIDFNMNDADGNPVALSSLYGKYLLVDFWASWCGPCRKENPNVVAIYNDYKDKGFDVYGVSFDDNKEKWLKAVEDDQLSWSHVSDLKGWGNAAGKLYAINSIPSNILLDPDGKIIGKNLRGEDLRNKIAELLDK